MSQSNSNTSQSDKLPELEYGLIKAHGFAALVAVVISALLGIFVSTKMHMPDMAASNPWMTWGRLRYDHTQGIFFGWLGNAFLLFMYHVVPRLANRPVLSKHLGWLLFAIWNFAVLLPGWVLVLAGQSQPLEWAEFPLIVDAFVVLALLLSALQFGLPLLKAKLSHLYVSGWYLIGALVFTLFAYPVGNIVPQLLPGAQGAAFSGLWIHDAIGLYVTPVALAIAYWVIPAVSKRPIYSHFLSMIGFWLLFFVYPLNGTHHYVFSAIPMEAQKGAIIASVFLGMDVILVVTNLLFSLKGAKSERDLPLRFVVMGTVFYLIVSLQGSLQALMPVNKVLHFSDWVIGHSHLAMLGFATFTAIGGITHAWQRIPLARFNARALSFAYWLLFVGLVFMVLDLSIAGIVEAKIWEQSLPWLESVRAVRGYWLARTISGLPILLAFISLWLSLCTGPRNESQIAEGPSAALAAVSSADESEQDLAQNNTAPKALNMAYLAASIAGLGFFLLSFGILGIVPGLAIESDLKRSKPATMLPLSASEERGRLIYAREGCAYCHTQQIRKVRADVERFGAPTRAWETVYDYPHLWGTRRIGPDLSRETSVRSDDWQLTHLYNPRLIVKDSMMPPYPWLFNKSASAPTQEGQDLLAYLKSLGRARELSGITIQPLPAYCKCPEDVRRLEETVGLLNANPNMAEQSKKSSNFFFPSDKALLASYEKRGSELFAQNCASCHGAQGRGDGVAAATLLPAPANLTLKQFSTERLSYVLDHGVYGSAMPAWRDLAEQDRAALVLYVSKLNQVKPVSLINPEAKALFVQHCASCHGVDGRGDGPVAGALAPKATNFDQVGPSMARALSVINDGIPGTSMPPWKDQLSLKERGMLAMYVASLYGTAVKAPAAAQENKQ